MSDNLVVTGVLEKVLPIQSGTSKAGKEWQKLDFVIETLGEYPKKIAFTLFGDKTSMIDGVGVGQEIEVSFNLESREYEGRWFSNINAWRVNPVAATASPEYQPPVEQPQNNAASDTPADDMPF